MPHPNRETASHSITITRCDAAPQREALNPLLEQYYQLLAARLAKMGVDLTPAAQQSALAEFWANIGEYLPPSGCLVLAQTKAGSVVGCGMLKRLAPDTAELKRLFVTDAARGTGTGRALIEQREAAARDMGLARLVADTLTPNVEMRSLYPKLGFREITGPIETTTYLEQRDLRPYLHFFEKDI